MINSLAQIKMKTGYLFTFLILAGMILAATASVWAAPAAPITWIYQDTWVVAAGDGIGDVNGDGYGDVAWGHPWYDHDPLSNNNEGKVSVFYGGPPQMDTVPDAILVGSEINTYLGYSVSGAGDVNGDGYDDLLVGGPMWNNWRGRVFLYYGSASDISTSANWTYSGPVASGVLGWSVSRAGDVNGDGYDDVIAGAYNTASGRGRVYGFYGSSSGLPSTPNWTLDGPVAGQKYGYTVSDAGDVNGDGYDDVIIGAYDSGGFAYVYHGSASGLGTIPAWVGTGENSADRYGWWVHTAGDTNHDGYADVIVSAYQHSGGQSQEGKVYLYPGSSSGLNTFPAWTVESNVANFWLGGQITGGGDVDGDGYADVMVSAYNGGGGEVGKAYVFLGPLSGAESIANADYVEDGLYPINAQTQVPVAYAGDV
jgi:hypothetical protein